MFNNFWLKCTSHFLVSNPLIIHVYYLWVYNNDRLAIMEVKIYDIIINGNYLSTKFHWVNRKVKLYLRVKVKQKNCHSIVKLFC